MSGLLQTVVVQIWQKKSKTLTCMTILCMIIIRSKAIAQTFLPSLDNANGRLCQERLLKYRNLVTVGM